LSSSLFGFGGFIHLVYKNKRGGNRIGCLRVKEKAVQFDTRNAFSEFVREISCIFSVRNEIQRSAVCGFRICRNANIDTSLCKNAYRLAFAKRNVALVVLLVSVAVDSNALKLRFRGSRNGKRYVLAG